MPTCGHETFRGVCDTAINTWLLNTMNRQPEKKEFYYWVTLTTHLPLVEVHDEDYRKFAEKFNGQGITEKLMQLAYQQQQLFKDLAGKLRKPGMPKVHILLVGDHAPPVIAPAERRLYNEQLIPYVELIPD
jgi:phosphoglycerol transferase MdoB-like AlkP superfamily enzyme